MKILVFGKHGQLASELNAIAIEYPHELYFRSSQECDITQLEDIEKCVEEISPEAIINTAAYTAVDDAEDNVDAAYATNRDGVRNIDLVAGKHNIKYIHISTDYVFDGTNKKPYQESDPTNPIGVYGKSKRAGEEIVLSSDADAIVIRTAWLYSSFGKNFLKTMIRLGKERDELNVVNDQTGTPTYTRDLAHACLKILTDYPVISGKHKLYHFANSGVISWYDFAKEIFLLEGIKCKVNPIPTSAYPTKATRPAYSVLSTDRIQEDFNVHVRNWKDALKDCLEALN